MEFDLVPTNSATTIILGGVSALLIAMGLLFVWVTWSVSHAALTVTDNAVQLRVPLYGRTIPISRLDLANAKVVNIDSGSEVRPTLRTNGIGLPGYSVGWFRLSDGSKALVAVTSRDRVLYVPTLEGFSLLVSVQKPDVVLLQLRSGDAV